MYTPSRYWRIAKSQIELEEEAAREFELPSSLTQQTSPPTVGDGLLLADYDKTTQSGIIGAVGVIRSRTLRCVEVDWRKTRAEIWVDTSSGRGNWSTKQGFRFATTKVAGYGLHQLFADKFADLEPRENLPNGAQAISANRVRRERSNMIARERLDPVEVIGDANNSPRGGYVYLLQSAYGYKVGRTRSMPNRMRTFGVQLPIMYTIPLCAWFDDHIEAESSYHRLFSDKRINGEWFNLLEQDVEMIRSRQYQA